MYLSDIVPKIASEIDSKLGDNFASYMIWSDARVSRPTDLDPNYLSDF